MTEEENKTVETITEPKFDKSLFLSGADNKEGIEPQPPVVKETIVEPVKTVIDSKDQYPDTVKVESKVEPKVTPTQSVMDEYWEQLKEDLGAEYKVPELIEKGVKEDGTKLTKKEKWEILRAELYKHTDFGDDEFVEEYKTVKKTEGFDRNKWLENKTKEHSLNDDDFLFAVYKSNYGKTEKNTDGLTDDQIKSEIAKMSIIEKKKEVTTHKTAMQNYISEENSKKATLKEQEFTSTVSNAQKTNDNLVKDYLTKIQGKNTIDGIEYSEAELLEFHKNIPNLLKIEIKTGKNGEKYAITKAQSILEKVMENEQSSLTLLPLLDLIDRGKLKGYSSALKEKVKTEIIDKLDPNPESTPGTSSEGPYTFDKARFLSGR